MWTLTLFIALFLLSFSHAQDGHAEGAMGFVAVLLSEIGRARSKVFELAAPQKEFVIYSESHWKRVK